ncbi:transaldolase [Buchnera aphidicola]|uniref:transaldolase n=1 Tax=Buchnera aphidicola TaxID=9 RepID=UPI0030EB50DE
MNNIKVNQLEQLKKYTKVVVDSGDIDFIRKYSPEDATTNPSLILQVVQSKKYESLVQNAILYSKKKCKFLNSRIKTCIDKIIVEIGIKILKVIDGFISSEVDARLSFNKDECIKKAYELISLYEEKGISRSRVLIKLASTWECIQAAKELKKDNINCNMTLLFSFAQAQACAEANVFLISPFVGRIFDWYVTKNPTFKYKLGKDPGVESVKKIFDYYKKYDYKTIIMGASFRNVEQILELSGCDRLTISPNLLNQLKNCYKPISKKLLIPKKKLKNLNNILTESDFRWFHNEDLMAVEKLSEGIKNFNSDQLILESIISKKI